MLEWQGRELVFHPTAGLSYRIRAGGFDRQWDPAKAPEAWTHAVEAGPVWALQRHLAHRLVLHAHAVLHEGKAVLVAAASGTGKSTIGAALRQQGTGFLTDDLASIGDELVLEAGPPHVRLWPDTRDWAGLPSDAFQRLLPDQEKGVAPMQPVQDTASLGTIAFLRRGDHLALDALRPADGAVELGAHTYAYQMFARWNVAWEPEPWHFRLTTHIARHVPLYRLSVPEGLDAMHDAARLLLEAA